MVQLPSKPFDFILHIRDQCSQFRYRIEVMFIVIHPSCAQHTLIAEAPGSGDAFCQWKQSFIKSMLQPSYFDFADSSQLFHRQPRVIHNRRDQLLFTHVRLTHDVFAVQRGDQMPVRATWFHTTVLPQVYLQEAVSLVHRATSHPAVCWEVLCHVHAVAVHSVH